ncbi:MAG TPA: helix-turn-helix transcriptional regulator [Solirubrobacterales bacterium]|nr:helix-turn-helix transcriptional regulator [Solirubrobacterales bacterium]
MGDSSQVARHFGRNMKRLRREAGLSQEALGFSASLHRTEVGLLERGERTPRIDTLVKVAAALGVRIDCPLLDGISWTEGTRTVVPGGFSLSGPGEDHAAAPFDPLDA